jgi:hypothetical protein
MDKKDTVLWLGCGFSHGSQADPAYRPPLGCSFFDASNAGVLERLNAYPVLEVVWKAYGSPPNLAEFWTKLDDDFNQDGSSITICESRPIEALRRSATTPARSRLEDYYAIYSEGPASPCPPGGGEGRCSRRRRADWAAVPGPRGRGAAGPRGRGAAGPRGRGAAGPRGRGAAGPRGRGAAGPG